MRITCDRCGKDRMVNEAHTAQRDMPLRAILNKMRHDGCGGRAGRAQLLTGIEGAGSRPVRRIALLSVLVLVGFLLATVLGLSSATPAAAADTVTIIGAGWHSCGAWTAGGSQR
jgi:hypothetical protein